MFNKIKIKLTSFKIVGWYLPMPQVHGECCGLGLSEGKNCLIEL